ncbi:MAG: hypothetical protein JW838_02640 [Spirochaetes bacterium]|nr:hypothetical protein [Spirochaetota bacterium]
MRTILCLSLALVFVSGFTAVRGEDVSVKEVKAAVADMVALLEAGKYRDFMEKYAPPKVVREMKQSGEFEMAVRGFEEDKSQDLLKHLRMAAAMEPTVDDAGAVKYADQSWRKPLVFTKIDGRWYLAN